MTQFPNSPKQLNLPDVNTHGQLDPEWARAVHDYMQQFHCSIHLDKSKFDYKELYEWCSCLGAKYKDWFIWEGGTRDKFWVIHIRSPKHSTFFRMKWNDAIIKSVDTRPDIV